MSTLKIGKTMRRSAGVSVEDGLVTVNVDELLSTLPFVTGDNTAEAIYSVIRNHTVKKAVVIQGKDADKTAVVVSILRNRFDLKNVEVKSGCE